jgi:hypothetical protein
MAEAPESAAAEFKDELVEILRQLNRVEMEATDVEGLEVEELHHVLSRGAYPHITTPEVEEAVAVLVGNRLARALTDLEYAWDRGRVVGNRYAITTEGKAFLLERLQRVGRID